MFTLLLSSYSVQSLHIENLPKTQLNPDDLDFNKTLAYEYIVTQLDFGFRVPGTSAHVNCSDWIINEIGYYSSETIVQDFIIQKEGEQAYNCRNILGKINPDKEKIVILGAHWDSRNVAEKDITNRTQPIPGANDGDLV